MIDRQHLRYFLAIVETGNFSRAAARMNVTQPTLSVAIAKLEQDLAAKLFIRNSRRVHLTAAGSQLLEHARAIEQEFNRVERRVRGLSPGRLVRLGVLTTIPTALVARVVEQHRAMKTAERVEILEGNERDLLGRLDNGRIDLALTILGPDQGRFCPESLFSEGYSLAVPLNHRTALLDSIPGEALADETMIVRRNCEALSAVSRYFTERGVRPEFSFRSSNDDRVLALVGAGLGITVMPDCYSDPRVRRPKLRGLELRRDVGLLFSAQGAQQAERGGSVAAAIRETLSASLVR